MKEVENYYDNSAEREWERLERHRIEFDITKRYLDKYLEKNSKILDAGGGPGRYSIYLAKQGHNVTLLDLSSENIKLGIKKSREEGIELNDYIHGNVLELSEKVEGLFDAVLCLGPLYHLTIIEDRKKAIEECLSKLKKGGKLFVSFITSYAPFIDTFANYPQAISKYKDIFFKFFDDGVNIVTDDNPGFTTAYFINPDEIEEFMNGFNIRKKAIAGLEGLFAQSESKLYNLPEKEYNEWVDVIYRTSTNSLTWAGSCHILYIGEKI